MKKIIGFILAVVLFVGSVQIFDANLDKQLQKKTAAWKQGNMYFNLEVPMVMEGVLEKDTMLILGSSEFNPNWEIEMDAFPTIFFNGGDYDFNVVIAGKGGTQCLSHAITVAAYGDLIQNKKVALVVSPQWFVPGGVSSKAFAGVFLPEVYMRWMDNNTLSKETTEKIQERTLELLGPSDPEAAKRVESAKPKEKTVIKNPVMKVVSDVQNYFMVIKKKYDFNKEEVTEVESLRNNPAANIDFNKMQKDADAAGAKYATNNPYGIYNSYYNDYVAGSLSTKKNSEKGYSYAQSKEYDDLRLFLQVCKEKGIKPMLIIAPVHGQWYDYTGHSKAEREKYYQNIRDIAKEYGAETADFSDKEYEKYFLADIMHIGWKGWVYIDESVYKFYKEK